MTVEPSAGWIWDSPGDYDLWTAAEAGLYYERYHDLLDLVVIRCRARAGDRVLDIGTGTGGLARRFAQSRGCLVLGLDPSPGMVAHARRKALAGAWGDVAFGVSAAPFLRVPCHDGTFDAVASTLAFHHVPESEKPAAIQEMARVLKPGGRLALGDPMFETRAELEAVLARWQEELEEECFAYLETLAPMFGAAGLSYAAERLSRINWVVWGEKRRGARC